MLDKITVNIPVLNEERNIEECIKSIRQSGIKKIIVIDGGSEDKTLTILKKFKNIKVVKVNKKGLAFQRMKCVLKCKTKYSDAANRTDNIKSSACYCNTIEHPDNPYNSVFNSLNTTGVSRQNRKCWVTPCRGENKNNSNVLLPPSNYELTNCKIQQLSCY